ncbi:hypothetical protein PXD04_09470 [Methanosphaera sp. ISO3-F5]|uniref:hypothetical protein n=1 Tax=Methanosphaera sp. ISO3-F5 TaxID=1452353 RepID=UPI002B256E97|nr:hypothetical protein [Methanosphaera sp. ISO3-F5]WQH63918.1 hypothetical protein PXD04_09470 [Methanosphaera sp. ISO3-F5]
MRGKKFKFFFLTFTFLLFLACLSGIHASNDTGDLLVDDGKCISKSVENKNIKEDSDDKDELDVTVNEVESKDYLSYTSITGNIFTDDDDLPEESYIHLYVDGKKQSHNAFKLYDNGNYKYTTKQKIGNHTFKIHINDPEYKTRTATTNFTVTDKIKPILNKSRPIYFAMDHTNSKDKKICNNIVSKLKQEGFKVVRYRIGPNAMYQNMLYLYKHKIHNAIMFHLFNGVDPSNIREVAANGNDNRGRIVRSRGNDVVLAWFYDASDPIHVGGNCYKSVRGSETGSRLYNPKEYMDKNNIYYICTSSDHRKHKSTADYNGDMTTLEFMKLFTEDKSLKYHTTTKAKVSLTDDYLVTVTGTVKYPTSTVNGYLDIKDSNNKTLSDNVMVKDNKFSTQFMLKSIGKQNLRVTYKGSALYSESNQTVTATISVKNATINVAQESNLVEDNSVSISLTEPNTDEILVDQLVKVTFDGVTREYRTNSTGSVLAQLDVKKSQRIVIQVYHDNRLLNTSRFYVKVYKDNVTVKLDNIKAVTGNRFMLRANVTDSMGNPVKSGYVVFKLNGRSFREGDSFNTSNPIRKFKVKNGVVNYYLTADVKFNAKNFVAVYLGNYRYHYGKSSLVKAVITRRYAKINISYSDVSKGSMSFVTKVIDTKKDVGLLQKKSVIHVKISNKDIGLDKTVNLHVNKTGMAEYSLRLPASLVNNSKIKLNISAEFVSDYYYTARKNRKVII